MHTARARFAAVVPALGIALLGGACGGSSTSPSDGGSAVTPVTGPIAATVTIRAGAVSPKSVTVPVGSSVMFVNGDSKQYDITSDPHPTHSDCPPINIVGTLEAGQSRATSAMTTARSCGYHDHNDSSNTAMQGTIVVQ
jgi:plastocyanin